MTEKDIRKYINRLNSGKGQESIFTRPISRTVEISKVWPAQPKSTDPIIGGFIVSYRFFFIKNTVGNYIGAILDMNSDLHWYIKPNQRKKGHLTKALREAVLPFLFNSEREKQLITIQKGIGKENYSNSKNVALKLGFKPINVEETKFELKESDFNWDYENIIDQIKPMSSERIEQLIKKVSYASKILSKVSDELKIAYNEDKGLSRASLKVNGCVWKIEDFKYNLGNDK